jgi:hypothetical protein
MGHRLSQVVAVEKGVKNECNVKITTAWKEAQKVELFKGIARNYAPKDEDGEKLPSESQKVQRQAADLITFTAAQMTKYWDITVTKDASNQHATADVVVDGKTLIVKAPVTFLLFLEKQLGDLRTIVEKVPTLDQAETWIKDDASGCYRTSPVETVKTRKVPRSFVRAAATKEHPAQVDLLSEDVIAGTWTTVRYSGAMPQARVTEILDRIDALRTAVKHAREEANNITAVERQVGKTVFGYLLA